MIALATVPRAAPGTAPTAASAPPAVGTTDGGRAYRARAVAFGCAVAALPLITPHGPANTSVADVGIALCVGLVLLSAAGDATALRVPYLVGMTMIVLAGALSALLAGAPLASALALVQDVAMLAWGAAVANAGRDPRLLRVMLHTWVVAATCYAALVTIGMSTGIDALAGRTETDGFRASFTLGDPNVSGNYFLVSFFLVRACQWPRSRPARWVTEVLLLVAVAFSGSNGALVGLVAGTLLAMLVRLWRVRDPVAAVGLVAALCLGGLTLGPHVHPESLQRWAADSVPLLRDGVGRSDQSSQERTQARPPRASACGWRVTWRASVRRRRRRPSSASLRRTSRRRTTTTSPLWSNEDCWASSAWWCSAPRWRYA